MTEKQIERKLKKIATLKSILRKEKAKFGGFDDSYGRRYSIAELYFEINNFKKTNLYLNWFNKNFPGDATYPYFQLNSAQTYFKVKKLRDAYKSLVKLNCLNIYLIDLINNRPVKSEDIPEWTTSEGLYWAESNYEDYKQNLTDEFIDWMDKVTSAPHYHKMRTKYISILKLIKYTEDIDQRKELFKAVQECEEQWQDAKFNYFL